MAVNFGVNYLAVVVAAVVALVIGFIWYSPRVFGTRWMAYLGTTQPQLGNPGPTGMLVGVVASLLNAWVLALLALNLGGKSVTDGVLLGVLAWLGFMATITAAQISFEKKSWGLWVLNNAHNLLVQVIMAAIVTAWR
ncbi:MAG TPA: DUF1761 domain-containing protein [Verrucomicrobiae bacterium]|nr:DUF1761 domain-containing protein [Verrucomicrobiae bacterium]